MSFAAHPPPVPDELVTTRFVLEPLTPAHVDLDYEAVMETREYLRLWSGTRWPADDFTLEGNLEDLERHHREHQDRDAYTYTILSPDRDRCLGCIYVIPIASVDQRDPQLGVLDDRAAIVDFWVRASALPDQLDRHVFDVLLDWFESRWSFPAVVYAARVENDHHRELLSARLAGVATVERPGRGRFVLFGTTI